MLVARLGLRSIEAARLQVDDLDWRAGRIILRSKASREDAMPLPADVGEALSAHPRQGPPSDRRAARCKCGRAGSAITTSNGSQPASDTQVSTVVGAGNFNLSVAADGMVVTPSNRAKLWAIICGGTRFWLTAK